MEAVMACWELEQTLQSFTGKSAFYLVILNGGNDSFPLLEEGVYYHICYLLFLIFSHHFLGNNEVNSKFFSSPRQDKHRLDF
jgi:hypothetical protein